MQRLELDQVCAAVPAAPEVRHKGKWALIVVSCVASDGGGPTNHQSSGRPRGLRPFAGDCSIHEVLHVDGDLFGDVHGVEPPAAPPNNSEDKDRAGPRWYSSDYGREQSVGRSGNHDRYPERVRY